MYRYGKIRNIAFVSAFDPGYREHCAQQRLQHMHLNSGPDTLTSLLAKRLEQTVRVWLCENDTSQERILTWEYLCRDNRYRRYYREIDFTLKDDNGYLLGELKVSSLPQAAAKARRQLEDSYSIARHLDRPITLMYIWVDMGFGNHRCPKGRFDPDFTKVDLLLYKAGNLTFQFLHLRPQALFEWGVAQNIIEDKLLLDHAIEEVAKNHCAHLLKRSLSNKGIAQEEWPEVLQKVQPSANSLISFGTLHGETLLGQKLSLAMNTRKGNA